MRVASPILQMVELNLDQAIGVVMPRFYFHLHDHRTIRDPEGQYFDSVEDARQEAIRTARGLAAAESKRTAGDPADRILVADENGNAVLVVPFTDALRSQIPATPARR
jgi:hypothetical protein